MKEHAAIDSAKGILQDLVVVVSLVRTLTESFGSASDLYRKLKSKRKKLESSDEEQRHRCDQRRRNSSPRSVDVKRHRRTSRSKSRSNSCGDGDEESIDSSRAVVKAKYEHGYEQLGMKFAIGDLTAQNQLQAQIIAVQGTIISIYQDCERRPTRAYRAQLLRSTRAARDAATDTLTFLYQRLLPTQDPCIPGAFPMISSSSTDLNVRKDRDLENVIGPHEYSQPSRLFCPYARDLQRHEQQPLADAYLEDGNGLCPYCNFHIQARPGRAWEVIVEENEEAGRDATFFIGNRFSVKSHRDGGGFACVLCARFRDSDTVCGKIFELMDHVWKDHNASELRGEEDIKEAAKHP